MITKLNMPQQSAVLRCVSGHIQLRLQYDHSAANRIAHDHMAVQRSLSHTPFIVMLQWEGFRCSTRGVSVALTCVCVCVKTNAKQPCDPALSGQLPSDYNASI